jgi:rhodanese-related sulfurtransferase
MNLRIATVLLLALAGPAGCRADLTGLRAASVDELASWRARRTDLTLCDVNNADTRRRHGVIPGAVLLSNYRDYDPESELPGDRDATLVFYCHSAYCGAAAEAARKALAAGYRDVWVLAPGITGWAEAGQPVEPAPATAGAS